MHHSAKIPAILLSAIIILGGELLAQTSESPRTQTRFQIYELLQMDCGTDNQLGAFSRAVASLGDRAELFEEALREGLSKDLENGIRVNARANYVARQTWIKQNAAQLFDQETVSNLSNVTAQEFIEKALRNADLRIKENSIRALGIVGDRSAVKQIIAAVQKEPDLSVIGNQTVALIQIKFE